MYDQAVAILGKMRTTHVRMTAHTDYALRLLIYCALRPDERVTVAQASEAYGISRAHVMKIAHELVKAGFLDSARGRNGGLRLARPPKAINIGKVARIMESKSHLVECFDRASNTCVIAPACSLKHLLSRADDAFYKQLETASLADIAVPAAAMKALLRTT